MAAEKRCKVLVVVSDETLRREAEEYMRLMRVEVEGVSTGAEGLERAARWAPDVVLMETTLPDQDAHLVCAKIKLMRPAPNVILLVPDDTPAEQHFARFVSADALFACSTNFSRVFGCIMGMCK